MPSPAVGFSPSDTGGGDLVAIIDAALGSMPYGFSIWDESLKLILVNQRYLDLYNLPSEHFRPGLSLEAVADLAIAAGNHPGTSAADLYALFRDRFLSTTDPDDPLVYERSFKGRIIRTTHVRRPGLGWVNVHEDITDQKRREGSLRQRNLQLDAALDSMPCGFCLWSKDLNLVLHNRRFLELYGLDASTINNGMGLLEVVQASLDVGNHKDVTAEQLNERYRSRLANIGSDETFIAEENLVSGRVVKVAFRNTLDGCWVATHEDVTEQKDQMNALQQRESELALQNLRFTAAVDNMSQGLCMFDNQRRLVICNKRYADLYGTPEALVRPGVTLESILQDRINRGFHTSAGADAYIQSRIDLIESKVEATDTVELQDGRVLLVLHHPMADGGWVSTHQDITEQQQAEARIRHLARHDALTDLPNRFLFREHMTQAEARIARREMVAVLFVDLDHYKAINDVFGHAVGDAVLIRVAARLSKACREGDIVARLGGDEFAILQNSMATESDAAKLAERLIKAMAEPMRIEGHEVVIGASVGIAVAPGDGEATEALMKNADLALYRAKAEGRGTYHFFEPAMDTALQEKLTFELDLRAALAAGELDLAYQPLFDLDKRRVGGFEALLRWQHPTLGTIMPDDIIPIAEETGLIVPIGEWVLRTACAEAATWPDHVNVAVNLSPVQFRHRRLAEQIGIALSESGIRPERLELEITESALLADNSLTLDILHRLRQIGVRIALDDFGTGYSSLSYLRKFPFDKLKIDRSFVRDIAAQPESFAVIKGVIGLGHSLGISTTAEGVETEDQLNLVRDQGCREVQGFLFSPPLPASAVAALLDKSDSETPEAALRRSAS